MKHAEDFGGPTIGFRHEVRVDVQGRRRVSMAEPARNPAHIDAGRQESRCDVVPEVMKTNPFDAGALACASESSRNGVWVARREHLDVSREHEAVWPKLDATLVGAAVDVVAIGGEHWTVPASSATRRTECVLVSFSTSPFGPTTIALRIVIDACSRSMSVQRSAITSLRRAPEIADSIK